MTKKCSQDSTEQAVRSGDVGRADRYWEAYVLGRSEQILECDWALGIEDTTSGGRGSKCHGTGVRQFFHSAVVQLADKINPGTLVEMHRVLDAIFRLKEENVRTVEDPLESQFCGVTGRTYFSWLHMLLNRAFEEGSPLALWCRLGGAIATFQNVTLSNPLAGSPPGGLGSIVETAVSLVESDNRLIADLERIAENAINLNRLGDLAFLETVLDRNLDSSSAAKWQEGAFLFEGVSDLDTRIQNGLLERRSDDLLQPRQRKPGRCYHTLEETRPDEFAFGPDRKSVV